MEKRTLGRTGYDVSVVGLGTWQLGADWGEVSDADATQVLETSVEEGVTFFDTADVYGDGRSEQVIGRFLKDTRLKDTGLDITVATKMGRREDQVLENYSMASFRAWTDRSRRNLQTDTLDLVQLHCPPDAVFESDEVFDNLDTLVAEGVIAYYGVSVETVAQAMEALDRPHLASIQIIVNAFRLKPLRQVLPEAWNRDVGIIARVPLASGLLSGKYDAATTFADDDHRTYNRKGEAFDVGETFSGVDFETGVEAAQEFSRLVEEHAPDGTTPAQAAIAWLWQLPEVSTVIPGARNTEQAASNARAGVVPDLGEAFRDGVRDLYDRRIRAQVQDKW